MSVRNKEKTQINRFSGNWQPLVFRFLTVIAAILIIIPAIPVLKSNLIYSFSGDAPKIYWYLSRASGFVTLSILWVSMALGLGLTNKTTHRWPGPSAAFAMHQYASLLGLIFAVSHGLILMGDHFVDFSLSRLVVPFSIAYETFWVGLGQICFYVWLVVILSFHARQLIGQRVWRLIHYINFAAYIMGFLHGVMSGTDSAVPWANWYFGFTGATIIVLSLYRIYDARSRRTISLPVYGAQRTPTISISKTTPAPMISSKLRNLTRALAHEQTKSLKAFPINHKEANLLDTTFSRTVLKATSPSRVMQLQGGNRINVSVFREPTTKPIPELMQDEMQVLFERMRQKLGQLSVEPTSPRRHS